MTRSRAEADADASKSYAFGIAVSREKHVRAHAVEFARLKPHELLWWREGPVPDDRLETVRRGGTR